MLERFRQAIAESYIGAVALGLLLAKTIEHFVGIVDAPIAAWVSQRNYREMTQKTTGSVGFPLEAALPEAVSAILLLLLAYFLIRWLYFNPLKASSSN